MIGIVYIFLSNIVGTLYRTSYNFKHACHTLKYNFRFKMVDAVGVHYYCKLDQSLQQNV